MKYVIAIEPGSDTAAWGVSVPDLPGCFSAGDTLDEAVAHAQEAIELHVRATLEDGKPLPEPRTLAHWQADPDCADCVWAVVEASIEIQRDRWQRENARAVAAYNELVQERGSFGDTVRQF